MSDVYVGGTPRQGDAATVMGTLPGVLDYAQLLHHFGAGRYYVQQRLRRAVGDKQKGVIVGGEWVDVLALARPEPPVDRELPGESRAPTPEPPASPDLSALLARLGGGADRSPTPSGNGMVENLLLMMFQQMQEQLRDMRQEQKSSLQETVHFIKQLQGEVQPTNPGLGVEEVTALLKNAIGLKEVIGDLGPGAEKDSSGGIADLLENPLVQELIMRVMPALTGGAHNGSEENAVVPATEGVHGQGPVFGVPRNGSGPLGDEEKLSS